MTEPEKISWTWRHAVAQSNLQATTKHVLLTISLYMNELGQGCYPTQDDLAKATSLSERAVRKHIDIAEKEGWIVRREHGFRGQKWRNHEYQPRWPERQHVEAEPLHVEKGAAPRSSRSGKGAAPRSGKVRHHVPSNVPEPSNTSLRSVGARDPFDEFAGSYPKPLGRDRAKARQEFDALSSEQQQRVIQATRLFAMDRASDREKRGETVEQAQRFTPNASRWLIERGWEAFDGATAQPLVVIRPEQPEWALIEKMRGQKLYPGGRGTATVLQSEIEAARAAERQIA